MSSTIWSHHLAISPSYEALDIMNQSELKLTNEGCLIFEIADITEIRKVMHGTQ